MAASFFLWSSAWAAEAEAPPKSSTSARSPQAASALASFQLKPGFRIELVAAEPMVAAPAAMAFDENGRLFVAEMSDSPDRRGANSRFGRIRLLEDSDGDGVFDTSTIYAENLPWPSAVACYAGGVFVAATPEIIYLKDTKGDGTADVRRVVLTGFGGTDNPLDAQALLNNFNWGLDNHIYGGTAGIGGVITAPNWPGAGPVSVAGSDFSFDPRTLTVFPEAGPARSGLSFDSQGRKFFSELARPLRSPMYASRYAARNPFFAKAPPFIDVLSPATPVFHFLSAEPPKPGGPAQSGETTTNLVAPAWLTTARGCLIYRGSAFPTNYLDNVFIADPEAHAIHHEVLSENGLEVTAARPPEERGTEFLLSRDPSFRPMQVVAGPEGALYIADNQNGNDRGRIYRIVPEHFQQPKPPRLGKARTHELVAELAKNDGWHRDTAARLLFERRDPASVPLLTNMLGGSSLPLARLRALHALDGLGALREEHALRGLRDPDERVRQHAVLLCERLVTDGMVSHTLWNGLRSAAADPSLRVRYQLAFTLGGLRRPDRAPALAEIVRRDPTNSWVQSAVLSSLAEGAGNLFVVLAGDPWFRSEPAGQEFLRRLGAMIGAKGRLDEVSQVLSFIDRTRLDRPEAFALLYALGEGLRRTQSSLALVDSQARLQRFYSQALDTILDNNAPDAARVEAIRLLGVSSSTFGDVGNWLLLLCEARQSSVVRSAAIAALGRMSDPRILTELIARWPGLTPPLRQQAITALLARNERVAGVVAALEQGRIAAADLSSQQVDFLRTHRDPAISQRAVRLFGPLPVQRPDAVQQFKPALRLRGAAEHGREIFVARCADCHQLGGRGKALGPDLIGARVSGREKILSAILEPNLQVPTDYASCVLETRDGENLIGIKADDNLATITLSQPRGVRIVWPRLNVESIETQPWSLMPEGLDRDLSVQDMADLLDYLMTAR
jgi:putative membrane-bound dehydrogenase-like protein